MNGFWGYASADTLALLVIGSISLACLICARIFVQNYGE